MVYKFADLVVEFNNVPIEVQKRFKDYESIEIPKESFSVTSEDIEYEMCVAEGECSYINAVLTAFLRKFVVWAIDYQALFLHSALVNVGGVGIAFSAPSGTGKTTHMRLWQKMLGEKLSIVNGDKPIVRFFENEEYPIGYGTPWNGKEKYGNNSKVPIRHLCFIERAEKNSCERVESKQILELFFNQIYIPKNSALNILNTLNLADSFLKKVDVWIIKCNMDIEAAEIAYNTIFNKNGQ